MAKFLFIAIFSFVSGVAVFVFINRQPQKKQSHVLTKERSPRVVLEEFTVYQYRDKKLISTLSGELGSFFDPNILEILGNVQGVEHNQNRKRSFSSESLTIHFTAKGLVDLAKTNGVEFTELENQVRFNYDDLTLFTDYAKYINSSQILSSTLPVRIVGPNVDLLGSKGFEYASKSNDLKVFGPLEGKFNAAK